jgi:hypothetical protein
VCGGFPSRQTLRVCAEIVLNQTIKARRRFIQISFALQARKHAGTPRYCGCRLRPLSLDLSSERVPLFRSVEFLRNLIWRRTSSVHLAKGAGFFRALFSTAWILLFRRLPEFALKPAVGNAGFDRIGSEAALLVLA